MSFIEIEYEGKTFSKSFSETAADLDVSTLQVAVLEIDTRTQSNSTGSVSWENITGDPANNPALVSYVASHSGASTWAGLTGLPSDNSDLVQYITFGNILGVTEDNTPLDVRFNAVEDLANTNQNDLITLANSLPTSYYPRTGNPSGFLTSVPAQSFASLTGKPTTVAGYGITDITAQILTGLNITGGNITASDSLLVAFGKLQNQISGLLGGATYQGVWNATTNSPALASSTGTKGFYYIVSVAGATNLDGITDWQVGDWAIFNGATWNKVDNTDAVSSVNGFTGAVSLTTSNIAQGTNLYFTNAAGIGATLTGYISGSGAISSADTLLSAIQKLNGNDGLKVPTSRTLTGTIPIRIDGVSSAVDLSANRTISFDYTAAGTWGSIQTFQNNALGATTTHKIDINNASLAAVGAQQVSPAIQWTGSGWKTTATAASQTVQFRAYVVPVQGTTSPTGYLTFEAAIAGGAFTNMLAISSDGSITLGNGNGLINNTSVTIGPSAGASGNLFCDRMIRGNSYVRVGNTGGNSFLSYAGTNGLSQFGNSANANQIAIAATGEVALGSAATASKAWFQLPAGTTANAQLNLAASAVKTTPVIGDFYFDNATKTLKFHDGTSLKTITMT